MDNESTVRALFGIAGVTPPEEEIQEYIETYPTSRATWDSLYAVEGSSDLDSAMVYSSKIPGT